MQNLNYNSNLLTPDEVSKVLKVGYRTVLDLINTGVIQAIKIGRQYRIPESSLEKYIHDSVIKPKLHF